MQELKHTDSDGTVRYFLGLRLHKEDGPAVETYSGTKYWYINGKRHRDDGPAVVSPNGRREWWIEDVIAEKVTFS